MFTRRMVVTLVISALAAAGASAAPAVMADDMSMEIPRPRSR